MQDPLNPLGNQDPLVPNQDPFEDPLLDALEHSIENPPAFTDPLAEPDDLLMDDLGRQLEQVEGGIENVPPGPAGPGVVDDGGDPDVQADEPVAPEALSAEDSYESTELSEEMWGAFGSSPPLPQRGHSHTPPPNRPESSMLRRGSGRSRRQKGPPSYRHTRGRGGFATGGHNQRHCPESHETIDEQQCEDCEKYRQWPQGTDDEPRECWYDWQARETSDDSDSDHDDEF